MASIRQEKVNDVEVFVLDTEFGTTATVAPGYGAMCSSLAYYHRGKMCELLYAANEFPEKRVSGRIPVLFPAVGRLFYFGELGVYRHKGKVYPMETHGVVKDMPWNVVNAEVVDGKPKLICAVSSTSETREMYPYDFLVILAFSVAPGELHIDAEIQNHSPCPMPFSYGYHPYFKAPVLPEKSAREKCKVRIPTTHYWEMKKGAPTGRFLPLPSEEQFASGMKVPEGHLERIVASSEMPENENEMSADLIDEDSGIILSQRFDPYEFETVTVYSPPGAPFVCIEPRTGIPMALSDETPAPPTGKVLDKAGESGSTIQLSVRVCIESL